MKRPHEPQVLQILTLSLIRKRGQFDGWKGKILFGLTTHHQKKWELKIQGSDLSIKIQNIS